MFWLNFYRSPDFYNYLVSIGYSNQYKYCYLCAHWHLFTLKCEFCDKGFVCFCHGILTADDHTKWQKFCGKCFKFNYACQKCISESFIECCMCREQELVFSKLLDFLLEI